MTVCRSSILLHIFYCVLLLLLVRISLPFCVSITDVMSELYVYMRTGAISRQHTMYTLLYSHVCVRVMNANLVPHNCRLFTNSHKSLSKNNNKKSYNSHSHNYSITTATTNKIKATTASANGHKYMN